jgi:hypothetical protein
MVTSGSVERVQSRPGTKRRGDCDRASIRMLWMKDEGRLPPRLARAGGAEHFRERAFESYQMYTAVVQTGQVKFTAIVATDAVATASV